MSSSPKTILAVCPHDCPDTCSMVVTVQNGQAIDLRGNKQHSFTGGALCQKVARYLQRVYHPGRLKYPMKRIGAKGEGQFERISWDEAIDTIASKFQQIAASLDGPEAILPYSYAGTMGLLQSESLDRRFFHRLGASLLARTICATAGSEGCNMTLGTRPCIDPEDVTKCRYIINWGSNTTVTNMHMWAFMHKARRNGAKIVTIDPYKCRTADRSDWWIPIRPGTDAALALGIMHILWRDGLQDDDYLEKYCLGTDQLRQRVLQDYPPERVADITGIPVADIEKLTREYATTSPSFIRLNYGMQRHRGGGMAARTICCLPAVVGAWRHVGGGAMLSTSPMFPFNKDKLQRPDLIPAGTRTVNMVQLAEALHGELPGPPVRALYVYNSNPAAVCPDQSRVLEGLGRPDLFTVVHEQFQTDTANYADILLPATTQLEHFDIHGSYGHLYVQVNEPAIAPLEEAKSNNDVFRSLAKRMGFEPELFEVTDEQLAEEVLSPGADGFFPFPEALDGITLKRLRKEGPLRLDLPNDLAVFAHGNFGTPSGKCEFYSETMAQMGFDPLPTYTPPEEDPQTKPELASRFPLQLLSPPAPQFLNSSFVNVDSLREQVREPIAEMHPDDAKVRNIQDGQLIRIFNDRGKFVARVVVGETVKPGVVVTQGIWWNQYTPDKVNCNVTTSTGLTDLGGGAIFFDNLVEVEGLTISQSDSEGH
ncbi:MAG: molybdopterin-dependent oxidoreductase [Gemmataceae bacterium]